ncbi:MAG: hypothetical protein DWQ04_23330 [Chloroflexi bacterium]|nr:MAG: hypothetical protein DWQ04_23330 [Chloroflexota bacterium]
MKIVLWVMLIAVLVGCAVPDAPTPVPQSLVLPSPQPVPATFTPGPAIVLPTASPLPTRPPAPTTIADTPIPFEDTVVELRYQIPAIGLDRRLQGNIGSQIILVDETTGSGQQRNNQATILLQLQQVLRGLELPPVPEGCDRCVQMSFELPLEEVSVSGWLQDVTLLASIENFMSVALGAHFPPSATAGLRRSASPYAPAQSLAVLEDGRLWIWQANQDTIPEPFQVEPTLVDAIFAVDVTDLASEYVANCPGVPLETLALVAEDGVEITIVCPEYSLPSTLMPLYSQMDSLMVSQLTDDVERPPIGFPLTAVLDYQRADDTRLTVYGDGTAVALDAENTVFTDTLTLTQVISLTSTLIESGEVKLGLTTFDDEVETAVSRILVRGKSGVYDGMWESVSQVSALDEINVLLDSYVQPPVEPTVEPTIEPTIEPTVEIEATEESTPSPSPTP